MSFINITSNLQYALIMFGLNIEKELKLLKNLYEAFCNNHVKPGKILRVRSCMLHNYPGTKYKCSTQTCGSFEVAWLLCLIVYYFYRRAPGFSIGLA